MKSTHRYKISTKACECVLLGVSIIKFFFENKTFEFVWVYLMTWSVVVLGGQWQFCTSSTGKVDRKGQNFILLRSYGHLSDRIALFKYINIT